MPTQHVPMIIWIRRPIPPKDEDDNEILTDNAFELDHWEVVPESIAAPAANLARWLDNVYRTGLIILSPDGTTARFIPPSWLCEAYFDVPPGGHMSIAARARR